MMDSYFKRPLLWDYLCGVLIASSLIFLYKRGILSLPKEEYLYGVVSDIATISLTLAGFILTLLTVLISYKSTAKKIVGSAAANDAVYDIFFSTSLYFQTVIHLKNAIKSLTILALSGYILKLFVSNHNAFILFAYNSLAVIVICFTLWRCLLILSKIIKLQKED